MTEKSNIVVVGLGEVGKPLFELVSKYHSVLGVDITLPSNLPTNIDVLHICYPFQIRDFVGECARYIDMFKPELTIINSTVAVGTTRKVAERTGTSVTYSPVRGKHTRMLQELVHYKKFIGALDPASGEQAARHFQSLGMKTRTLSSPEAAELAKLTETTYFGLMIAWAQEVERYADQTGASYDEIVSFYEEIGFFPPVKYTSGVIGGHCVMPNIELLRTMVDSQILNAIKASNEKKIAREESVLKIVDIAK
jgi:UDP-N-acetyl-D-mannosaminuronate dehydrogenase